MSAYQEILELLKSKVKSRQLFAELEASDLAKIIKRLETVHEEKQLAELEEAEKQEGKKEALKQLQQQMKELGLSPEDLGILSGEKKQRKQYAPRQKYVFSYQSDTGQEREWVGAVTGRMPGDFSEYLERTGKDRKECIKQELPVDA